MALGVTTLGAIRTTVRQRADMVNSQFITDTEFNGWINASHAELYDILIQKFGADYLVAPPYFITTTTALDAYALPTDFYKLLGVDVKVGDVWATLKPFAFSDRNRFAYFSAQPTIAGVPTVLRYRLRGNNLWLTPVPSAGTVIRAWYAPRRADLVSDSDQLDCVSGWEEYVVVDVVIKAKTKQESDVSVELALKKDLLARIESASQRRDAGEAPTVADTQWGQYGVSGPWRGWGGGPY